MAWGIAFTKAVKHGYNTEQAAKSRKKHQQEQLKLHPSIRKPTKSHSHYRREHYKQLRKGHKYKIKDE